MLLFNFQSLGLSPRLLTSFSLDFLSMSMAGLSFSISARYSAILSAASYGFLSFYYFILSSSPFGAGCTNSFLAIYAACYDSDSFFFDTSFSNALTLALCRLTGGLGSVAFMVACLFLSCSFDYLLVYI